MNVNVFMSMYFCLSLSSSLSQPMSLSPVSLSSFGERERERESAGKEMFYARKYLFNTKEGINEDTGEQKIHKAYWKKITKWQMKL